MAETRKTYKDSVFRKLFGDSSNRNALLALYNALNQTNYDDPSELIINTIDDAIYMGIKNDISCIIVPPTKHGKIKQQNACNNV